MQNNKEMIVNIEKQQNKEMEDSVLQYEIMSGKTTKNISRNKVIMLCFGLKLTVDEAQQLLKKSGYAPLYARDTRDSIIIYSLEHHIDVVTTNIKLGEYSLEILK